MEDLDEWPWMHRALQLAEKGRGRVEPNPLVGAVVVQEDSIIGEGWHRRFGEAHAEVNALALAAPEARGATLYVTLEPCCHHGKTPPCTDAILAAGIRRVVVALADPFPEVAGQGAGQLLEAGVAVEFGLGAVEGRLQNAPYLKLLSTGRPYVHAKWAMTLDGKISTAAGDSRWITNEQSRQRVHELRGRVDAVLVGSGTVLSDDPLLTARPPGPRVAARVVLDRRGRLPADGQLVQTAWETPLVLATTEEVAARRGDELRQHGCEVLALPNPGPLEFLAAVLDELGRRRWTNVLVEGGADLLGSCLDLDAIDEVHAYLATKLVGGATAPSPVHGTGLARLADARKLKDVRVEMLDGDVLIHGRLHDL